MSDNTKQGINTFKQHLEILPEQLSCAVLNRIRESVHYVPVVGIMGKTGTGKFSLVNAVF